MLFDGRVKIMKILIAGFQHETNTFAPTKASYQSFIQGEGFPPMARGARCVALRDVNVPIGGFIKAAEANGHELMPVIWAGASASAHVTTDAFERIGGEIVDASAQGGFDAIYLDLHGAMVTEHLDDGEGEIARTRAPDRRRSTCRSSSRSIFMRTSPRACSKHASALVAYRTYPHVDMAETGERAARILEAPRVRRPPVASRGASRAVPDSRERHVHAGRAGARHVRHAGSARRKSLSCRCRSRRVFRRPIFPNAGRRSGRYAFDQEAAERAVDALYAKLVDDEARWDVPFLTPDEAALEAIRLSRDATKPVIIADTQDNPGVGGDSNTMGMVRALLRNGATRCGGGRDLGRAMPRRRASRGRRRANFSSRWAAAPSVPGDAPLEGEFEVEHLSDGRFRFDGPMLNGMQGELGPVACLRIEGVQDRGELDQDAGVRSQSVPRRGHRARANEDSREQELGAFSRGFRGDCRGDTRGEGARTDGRRSGRSAVGNVSIRDMRVRPLGAAFHSLQPVEG